MLSPPDVGVVVVAAGAGRRAGAGAAKQFREIGGIPMLLRALGPFLTHAAVGQVVAVVPPEAAAALPAWLTPAPDGRLKVVAGGAERIDSVARGFEALGDRHPVVIVHDGARPFVESGVIDAVIAIARTGQGAVAAIPVSDTLKMADGAGESPAVKATVPREGLWRAQTPQAFPVAMFRRALAVARAAHIAPTDDSAMVEAAGGTVVLVPDRATNIKITTGDDFQLAEAIARSGR